MARVSHWLATCLGVGYLPIAPGSWGSLLAVAIAGCLYLVSSHSFPLLLAGLIGSTILGTWAADRVASDLGDSDPSRVVIDEVAGQFLTLMWVPLSPSSLFLGFVFFRVFDILKPPPARQAEGLPGGYGIMTDDLVAGVYAGLLLLLARWLGFVP